MGTEHAAMVLRPPAKGARRRRQPAPRCRTPLGSVRRFNNLARQFARDLGRGDLGRLPVVEREMIRQAATLLGAEQLQAAVVAGLPVDADELIRLSSEARRILAGLQRRSSVTEPQEPTLAEYLASLPRDDVAERQP